MKILELLIKRYKNQFAVSELKELFKDAYTRKEIKDTIKELGLLELIVTERNKRWMTPGDEVRLRHMRTMGLTNKEIGYKIGKTANSVAALFRSLDK